MIEHRVLSQTPHSSPLALNLAFVDMSTYVASDTYQLSDNYNGLYDHFVTGALSAYPWHGMTPEVVKHARVFSLTNGWAMLWRCQ